MTLDFLTAKELTMMRDDASDLLSDRQISGSVIYRSFVSIGTFDPFTGSRTATYAGTWTNALKVPVTEKEIETSESKYQLGDIRYLMRVADIRKVKKDDRLQDADGYNYFVVGHATDALGIYHSITVRNLDNA